MVPHLFMMLFSGPRQGTSWWIDLHCPRPRCSLRRRRRALAVHGPRRRFRAGERSWKRDQNIGNLWKSIRNQWEICFFGGKMWWVWETSGFYHQTWGFWWVSCVRFCQWTLVLPKSTKCDGFLGNFSSKLLFSLNVLVSVDFGTAGPLMMGPNMLPPMRWRPKICLMPHPTTIQDDDT